MRGNRTPLSWSLVREGRSRPVLQWPARIPSSISVCILVEAPTHIDIFFSSPRSSSRQAFNLTEPCSKLAEKSAQFFPLTSQQEPFISIGSRVAQPLEQTPTSLSVTQAHSDT